MSIPKTIFSVWVGGDPPEIVKKCLKTHKREGYENILISNENWESFAMIQNGNTFKGSPFAHDAMRAKHYVKVADYVRLSALYHYGGFFCDGDLELKTNLDDLCENRLVTCQEDNGMFATGFIGAEKGHPMIKELIRRLDENFRGDGDLVFESGVRAFADLVWVGWGNCREGLRVLPPEDMYKEPFIRARHWYLNSWIK